ncbi:MAG TPA: carboxypeptidase regulatory-like domain-containing protein [Gemmatimonadaceae bacterium]|nr:carboxypeptidase regulatory-like domain-containing protein [Gemmatimonadaceae bacterium]
MRICLAAPAALFAGSLITSAAIAQTPVSGTYGSAAGIAVDSIHGGYLKNAVVSLVGTSLSAITDSAGYFQINQIPSGTFALRLDHPYLDTLGIRLVTRPTEITPGSETRFVLSIPSPSTFVARKCSDADRKLGGSALAGTVADASTEEPSVNATVIVAWVDVQFDKKKTKRTARRRVGSVNRDGTFLICGIPSDLAANVFAFKGRDSTASVPIDFSRGVATQAFAMPHRSSVKNENEELERLAVALDGKVIDSAGAPVPNAVVGVASSDASATTDAEGRFELFRLKPGTQLVTIRKIGWEAVDVTVNLTARAPQHITVTLGTIPQILAAVRVSGSRVPGLERVGFNQRKKLASGNFFTPEQIAVRKPENLVSLLSGITYLRTTARNDGERAVSGRFGDCVRYWVDGVLTRAAPADSVERLPDSWLPIAEVKAVEVYSRYEAPAEFIATSNGAQCNIVVIWTNGKLAR